MTIFVVVDRIQKGQRVRDVGCGMGTLTFDIADKSGAKVHAMGVDMMKITSPWPDQISSPQHHV